MRFRYNVRWFFFFFKQKTAYEMRISDWSSDVCSSDLLVGPAHRRFGKRTTAIAGGLIGMAFWVTPFLLRHLHLWPVEGSMASTAGLFVFFFLANLFSVAVMISGGSMIAAFVAASEVQTGRRSDGTLHRQSVVLGKGVAER